MLLVAVSGTAQSTRTAVASPPSRCPDTFHSNGSTVFFQNSFEVAPQQFPSTTMWRAFHSTGVYPPAGTWGWSGNGNGIAGELSGLARENGPAPDGDFVLWLQSSTGLPSFVQYQANLPGGAAAIGRTFRVSFLGAQRLKPNPTPTPLEPKIADRQIVRVTVVSGGVPPQVIFNEELRDGVYRRYVSRPFLATSATVAIELAGIQNLATAQLALIDLVEFREVLPWGVAATWGGQPVPVPTDDVTIPEAACVGIGIGQANTVTVEGELHVLENAAASLSTRTLDVHVAAASLGVVPTGTSLFQVGRENVPYLGKFVLVLDDDRTQSLPDHIADQANWNGLHVADDGWVELHGAARTSWLRLAENAGPASPLGPSVVKLEAVPLGWGVGDRIVVAPSGRDFDQAEQRTINSIAVLAGGQAQVALTTPLQFDHCGQQLLVTPPWLPSGSPAVSIDQRAEVGLLTHTVRVMAIPRTDPNNPNINVRPGGHIMIEAHAPALLYPGFGRFSQAELEGLGRAGQKGRYPIHWHLLLGSGKGQYMKGCSIHHSDSRVVAIHGTDYVLFENNVAYEHFGHGVFIEDGSEQFNVFRNNLVMATRLPGEANALLPSDRAPRLVDGFQNRAPAAFWITNPNNVFEGNVVAGADGTGYWFALPRQGWMGFSQSVGAARTYFELRTPAGEQRRPNRQILGSFADNSCHSAFMAFDVHDSISETQSVFGPPGSIETNVTWDPYDGQLQTLPRFRAYSCGVGIYTGNGDQNLRFDEAGLADCSWPIVMASHDIVRNTVVVEDSGHALWPIASPGVPPYFMGAPFRSVGIVLYDGAGDFQSVHFVGFDASTNSAAMWPTGAARRRTNIATAGMSYANTGGVAVSPRLGLDDVSASPPATTNYNLLDFRDPRRWAYSVDNPDRSLFPHLPAQTPPLTTIVSNHPMVANTGLDVPVVAGRSAVASPFRFAYLRTFQTQDSNDPNYPDGTNWRWEPQATMHDLRYQRHWSSPPTGTASVVIYEDRWRVDPYRQMAVIVDRAGENNGFRYVLDWYDAGTASMPPNPAPTIPAHTQLWLGEMKPGDICRIGLQRYAGNHPVTGQPPTVRRATSIVNQGQGRHPSVLVSSVSSWAALDTATTTSLFAELSTGILWLKITSSGMIPLEADGTGQAIMVDF